MPQDKTIKGVMETKIKQALARGYCYTQTEMKVLDPDLIQAMSIEVNKLFQQEIKDALESVVPEKKVKMIRGNELGEICKLAYNEAIDDINQNIKHYIE